MWDPTLMETLLHVKDPAKLMRDMTVSCIALAWCLKWTETVAYFIYKLMVSLTTKKPVDGLYHWCRQESRQETSTSVSEPSGWISDSERLAQAAERSGNECSSSSSSAPHINFKTRRRWHDTGIELAKVFSKSKESSKGEDVDITDMTPSEAIKYYNKEFGNDPLYSDLVREFPLLLHSFFCSVLLPPVYRPVRSVW